MAFDTTQYPYDTIVRITDTIGPHSWQGSGVLISPDEVLTASHVVYIEGQGVASNITVSPGYNGSTAPFGVATGTFVHYIAIADQNRTIDNFNSQFDYAVIHLNRAFTNLGTMGLLPNYAGGAVTVGGFPGAAGGQMITSLQTVIRDPRYTLLDGVSIGEGSSGGPVWVGGSGTPQVVGIVSSESRTNDTGYFTQISTAAFNQIQAWVAIDDGAGNASNGIVRGSAAAIAAQFDVLEASATAGKLVSVTITDGGTPAIVIGLNQLLGDKDVLRFIAGSFTIDTGLASIRGRSAPIAGLALGAGTGLLDVRFADGDLSYDKAASPAQLTRLYQAALNRLPDQPGLHNWIGQLAAGTTLRDVAAGFVGSAEFIARYGANLGSPAFVTQLYANVLHRAPDSLGGASWNGLLSAGASRADVMVGFSESAENVGNTASTIAAGVWNVDANGPQVARLYDTVFGRVPDLAGLQNWEIVLGSARSTLDQVAGAFTNSAEFQAQYGALANGAFVTALYNNALHRGPDQAGLAGWVSQLDGGMSRSAVVLGFSESAEHQSNTAANIISGDPANYGIKTT